MSVTDEAVSDWGVCETQRAIQKREISAVEVCDEVLSRIEAKNPTLNAFLRVYAEDARSAAAEADKALAQGDPTGRLHGVPLAHKDMFDRKGYLTTCGSAIRRDYRAQTTATVLDRVEAEGAINIGALNMSEFANGPTGHNEHWGECRNPVNPAHIPGGSSSGSGSAVGGGLVAGSLCSDTTGSIRLPAAMCGVYGLKPTNGRVSRAGAMGVSFSLDAVGPIARRVEDCARLLSVISGPDAADPTVLSLPHEDFEAGLDDEIAGMTIRIPENYYFDDIDHEIAKALDEAIKVFESLGAHIERVTLPHHDIVSGLLNIVVLSEQCTLHDYWQRTQPDDYSPLVRGRMKAGFGFTAVEYLKALQMRAPVTRDVEKAAFTGASAMLIPALRFPVPTLIDMDVKDHPRMREILGGVNHCVRTINYFGFPAISCPAGRSASGLPIGFQLVGANFSERTLLRIARAHEKAISG